MKKGENTAIDVRYARTENEMHKIFAQAFSFPAAYGCNAEALWDYLWERFADGRAATITIMCAEKLTQSLKEVFEDLEKSFPRVRIERE